MCSAKNDGCKETSQRACTICGSGFDPKNYKQKTCSDACRKQFKKQQEWARIGKATCTVCNQEWQPNSPVDAKHGRLNKYCSKECRSNDKAWRFRNEDGERKWLTYGTEYRPYYAVFFNTCVVCEDLFSTSIKTKSTCSEDCLKAHQEESYEKYKATQRERYSVTLAAKKAAFIPVGKTCKECNTQYFTTYERKKSVYCSVDCSNKHSKRIHKAVRRARKKAVEYESVNPFAVFERDKWTCRICGIKTPKKLRGQMVDNAPELDHIIALAKGGSHTYSNVQCACRKCNGMKSDKLIGQQVLFATVASNPGGRLFKSTY